MEGQATHQSANGQTWHASVDASGRVMMPAELRRMMNVEIGSSVMWVRDEHGLHLQNFEDIIAEIQDYYKSLGPADEIWSEQLIAERRREAGHE